MILIVATLMVPLSVILVPLYSVISALGLFNSLWGVILPTVATPTGVFLLRQYMLTIPDELLDAARMDKASEWQIYWRIVLPLTAPALAVLAIFSVVWRWNDFLWPLIVLSRKELYTLQVGLNTYAGRAQRPVALHPRDDRRHHDPGGAGLRRSCNASSPPASPPRGSSDPAEPPRRLSRPPRSLPFPIGQVPPPLGAGGRGVGETRANGRAGAPAPAGENDRRSAKALRPHGCRSDGAALMGQISLSRLAQVLRRHRGHPRRQPRHRRRRARGLRRPLRLRQVHAPAADLRPRPPDLGQHRHRRPRRHRQSAPPTAASPWSSSPTRSTRT